jgi:hypothetical protein
MPQSVKNSSWKRLWTCHKTDNRMVMNQNLITHSKNPLLYVEDIPVHTMKVYVGVEAPPILALALDGHESSASFSSHSTSRERTPGTRCYMLKLNEST